MGLFNNKYPYTDFHELNLDWILSIINKLENDMRIFVDVNTIKYSDPLTWSISKQYEQNTLVQDDIGNTYLSRKPVPSGISLTDDSYWIKVADFELGGNIIRKSIAENNDGFNITSSKNRGIGDLVWLGGYLYKVIRTINTGDRYTFDLENNPNVEITTIEKLINDLKSYLSDKINDVDGKTDLNTERINDLSDKINSYKYNISGTYNHSILPGVYGSYKVTQDDGTNYPFNQSMCSDNNFIYTFLESSNDAYNECYRINRATGDLTKIKLDSDSHWNDCTIIDDYIICSNDSYRYQILDKNNLQLIFTGSLETVFDQISHWKDNLIVTVDGALQKLYIYDFASITNPILLKTLDVDILGRSAIQGSTIVNNYLISSQISINDSVVLGSYSTKLVVYDLENGEIISTIILPNTKGEIEGIDYIDNKIIMQYQRIWDGVQCTSMFYQIPLYSNDNVLYAEGLNIQNFENFVKLYCDNSYNKFYVDGTENKPFISLQSVYNYIDSIKCKQCTVYANNGTYGDSVAPSNIDLSIRDATIRRTTIYNSNLTFINCHLGFSTSTNEALFVRNSTINLNSCVLEVPNTIRACNIAYSNLIILGNIRLISGEYGISATFCDIKSNATYTVDSDTLTFFRLEDSDLISANNVTYARAGSSSIIISSSDSYSVGSSNFTLSNGETKSITIDFNRFYQYNPFVFTSLLGQANDNINVIVTAVTRTNCTLSITNNTGSSVSRTVRILAIGA